MREFTLGGFARHLEALAVQGPHVTELIATEGATLIQDRAKAKIGHYQPEVGGFPAWAPLADSTEAEKRRIGAPANAPLLRHGGFYASIEQHVRAGGLEAEATVGTDWKPAIYHELGTEKMPPRPVFGPAAMESWRPIASLTGDTLVAWLAGENWLRAPQVTKLP